MRAVLLAVLLALASIPAFAQTPDDTEEEDFVFDRDCMDEDGRDLCDEASWGAIVASYGLEPAGALQAKGQRGVRVFTIDGYATDMPMVSILGVGQDKNGDLAQPMLEVRGQMRRGGDTTDVATLRREAWSDLAWQAQRLQDFAGAALIRQSDATLPRKPVEPPANGDIVVMTSCKHEWLTITESLTKDGVVRRIRSACDDDPLFEASFSYSGYALRGFPHCNHIDPANQRNESTQLQRCLALEGDDRIAAAQVLNILDGGDLAEITGLANRLAPNAQLLWPERSAIGPAAIATALSGGFFDAVNPYVHRLEGASGRVSVSGALQRWADDGMEAAAIEETWLWQDGDWRLADMTVAPFELVR